jgi:hypothetical protein
MELDQWIAIYGSVTQTAASKEKAFWSLFACGLMTAALFVLAVLLGGRFAASGVAVEVGVIAFGWVVGLSWAVAQVRLHSEIVHWERLLRSLESQFAGGEFHRSVQRLDQGEPVCVPGSAWACDEWQNEAVRFSRLFGLFTYRWVLWTPVAFLCGLVVLFIRVVAF